MNRRMRAAGWKHMRHNERINVKWKAFAKREGHSWVVRGWGDSSVRGVARSFRAAVFDWVTNDFQARVLNAVKAVRLIPNVTAYVDGKAVGSCEIIIHPPSPEQVAADLYAIRKDSKTLPNQIWTRDEILP